jgi:hypothetical protein
VIGLNLNLNSLFLLILENFKLEEKRVFFVNFSFSFFGSIFSFYLYYIYSFKEGNVMSYQLSDMNFDCK